MDRIGFGVTGLAGYVTLHINHAFNFQWLILDCHQFLLIFEVQATWNLKKNLIIIGINDNYNEIYKCPFAAHYKTGKLTLKCLDTTGDWRQYHQQIHKSAAKSRIVFLGVILRTSWVKSVIVVESRLGIVNNKFPSEKGTVFTRRLSNQQKNLAQGKPFTLFCPDGRAPFCWAERRGFNPSGWTNT